MRTFRIGLTGGIASGKSTVADLFAARAVPVIDTDEIARAVVEPGQPALARLVKRFGPEILDADGRLDRRKMRGAAFANAQARRELESILHPAIHAEMERRAAQPGGPYQIIVIPLLVEKNLRASVDRVLVVDVPPELQIERLRKRDTESEAQARAMLAAQVSRAERLAQADDVIANDGSPTALTAQVEKLHAQYLELARRSQKSGR